MIDVKWLEAANCVIKRMREQLDTALAASAAWKASAKKQKQRVAELEKLLDEWTNTPFFENQDEWLEWVNEYGPRVEAALNK